ncbi:MAG: DUF1343 domain-containing protein [Bacteroidetes bacterium]|nr:DUF1343 domain-containing protein [Bacteroidota bacterium]
MGCVNFLELRSPFIIFFDMKYSRFKILTFVMEFFQTLTKITICNKMLFKELTIILIVSIFVSSCSGQGDFSSSEKVMSSSPIKHPAQEKCSVVVGAEQTNLYLPLLLNKKVGIVANHTSMINAVHLVDSLLKLKVNIKKVYSPEHGFRGNADAGEKVKSNVDAKTKLPIISLYGKNKKPTPEQLKGLEVIIFDIQDVGARFYTYISTMHYVMEACAENNIKFVVLDRPNPNGDYVDGPILENEFKSFVGMHQVPIVHGMTVGEYAQMINGEGWLAKGVKCNLEIIKLKNYTHKTIYELPIKPSPNLANMQAIYLYPSLCLFEGTPISVGRGTDRPFQVIGHPQLKTDFSFVPKPTQGAKEPLLKGETCYGLDLSGVEVKKELDLSYLIRFYNDYPDKEHFFNNFFNTLAGNATLQEQIKQGKTAQEINATWQKGLLEFKAKRKKYLLYDDFE